MADSLGGKIIDQGFGVSTGKVQQEATASVANLGQQIAGIAAQREQLEMAKQQMEEAKLTKFVDALDKGKTFKGVARSNYYKKFMPRMRDSLGLTDKFPDEALEFMTADEENLNRVAMLAAQVQEGTLTGTRALEIAHDPVKFAQISSLPLEQASIPLTDYEKKILTEAGKFAEAEKGKTKRTHIAGAYAANRQATDIAAVLGKTVDAETAKSYDQYMTEGGKAGLDTNIAEIEDVLKKLKSGEAKTRNKASFLPGDYLQKVFNEDALALQSRMHKAIQSSLRATLGAQFTQQEGERILNNTFDPKLSTATNIQRLEAELSNIRKTRANKEGLFKMKKLPLMLGEFGAAAPQTPAAAPQAPMPQANLANMKKAVSALTQAFVSKVPNAAELFAQQAKQMGYTDSQIKAAITKAQQAAGGQ